MHDSCDGELIWLCRIDSFRIEGQSIPTQILPQAAHKLWAGICLDRMIAGHILMVQAAGMCCDLLVMTKDILDGRILLMQVADQLGICLQLGFREVFRSIDSAYILNTDGAPVITDRKTAERRDRSQLIDRAIAVDQEL